MKAQKRSIQPVVQPIAHSSAVAVAKPDAQSRARPPADVIPTHDALEKLLPRGVRCKRPSINRAGLVVPSRTDYTNIIDWLQLPKFTAHNVAHNWLNYFAQGISESKVEVAELLVRLVECGAQPQNREGDLYFAWWELAFAPEKTAPRISRDPNDAVAAISKEIYKSLAACPKVSAKLAGFTRRASSIAGEGWNPRSVLSLLGYSVGRSGPRLDERRAALGACLILGADLIPSVQKEFWGAPATRRRAHSIVRMIHSFIALAAARTHGDWSKACADWAADLQWMDKSGLSATGSQR